jgi:thiol-disulfide isomerase/thioredoxin
MVASEVLVERAAVRIPRPELNTVLLIGVALLAGCSGSQSAPAATASSGQPSVPLIEVPAAPEAEPEAPIVSDTSSAGSEPGWLGVELAARAQTEAGVLVRDVLRGSPAERAGLTSGDVILSVDGKSVLRPSDVVRLVSSRNAGEKLSLAVQRGGADRLFGAVLAPRPEMDELLTAQFTGSPAPQFRSLKMVQGSVPDQLSALRGRVVVVEFWASWCAVCRITVPTLNAWHDRYSARGLTVLGVTTDPPGLASQAGLEFGINYAVASDEGAETSRVYRAHSIPTLYLIDREGVVRDIQVGYSSARLAQTEAKLKELLDSP